MVQQPHPDWGSGNSGQSAQPVRSHDMAHTGDEVLVDVVSKLLQPPVP